MHILIAGGGIGGLAAAVALLQRGIDVDIYEQAAELKEVGAGIQVSPNGNKVLDRLGVFQQLKELSCDPVRKEFRFWSTGKPWPLFSLGKTVIEKYGYPYLTVYRPDLLAVLAQRVNTLKPGAIHLSSRVASCRQDAEGAFLMLESGQHVRGDALIGADGGARSVVRKTLWGPGADPAFQGLVTWRGLISMETLPEHMRAPVGLTWIGPGAHVVNYPLRGGKIMNFVATIERQTWNAPSGSIAGTHEECLADFKGWHEDVQTMISKCSSLSKWALMQRDPIPHWGQGRITLLGDAAHATLPFLAQGAVHAIEDGAVLARCLERVDKSVTVEQALQCYEATRIGRTSRMVRGATANTARFHSEELATEASAEQYLQREWSADPIFERYDWLYSYDANSAPLQYPGAV